MASTAEEREQAAGRRRDGAPQFAIRRSVVLMTNDEGLAIAAAFDRAAQVVADGFAEEGIEAIIVGIPNAGGQRLAEYSPFDDRRSGVGRAGYYLSFLIDTVKPLVDAEFRTTGRRERTDLAC